MRSKTSCFNAAFFGRTLLRLWPLWAIASAIFFFLLPAPLWQTCSNGWSVWTQGGRTVCLTRDVTYSFIGTQLPVLMAMLGCLSAMFAWRWLNASRSANCYFSLPLRREGLFLTHFAAGYCATLIPIVFVCLTTFIVSACYGAADARSLLTMLVTGAAAGLLFFSLGTLCAMATGHTVAVPVFFVIANFLVAGVFLLVTYILGMFVFGMGPVGTPRVVFALTPLLNLTNQCVPITRDVSVGWDTLSYLGAVSNLWYYGAYAGAGAVLAGISMLMLRRRPAESAGDIIAFRVLRPVFQIGLSVCFGLAMTVFIESMYFLRTSRSMPVTLLLVVAWSFVGFFGAEMLLRKSFRVFRAKAIRTWAVLAVVIAAAFASVGLDAFGYESRIPDEADVASVSLQALGTYDEVDYETAYAVHRAILDARDTSANQWNVFIDYRLKNGRTVSRNYEIDTESEAYRLLHAWATKPESLEQAAFGSLASTDQLLDLTVYDYLETYDSASLAIENEADAEAILEAIRADFAEGNSGFDFQWGGGSADPASLDLRYQVTMSYYVRPYDPSAWKSRADYTANCSTSWTYIYIPSNMTHTCQLLETLIPQLRQAP